MKRDEQKVVGEREKRNLLYWEGFWTIFPWLCQLELRESHSASRFAARCRSCYPSVSQTCWVGMGSTGTGMWQWGTGGVWELQEQRVMGRAASSVCPLVSFGIMAMSSSQAAREAVWGRDGRAGEPGGASLPRSWLH